MGPVVGNVSGAILHCPKANEEAVWSVDVLGPATEDENPGRLETGISIIECMRTDTS